MNNDDERDYAEEHYNGHLLDDERDGGYDEEDALPIASPEHADYPHEPGRLHQCPACEASCHCTAGATECVYAGEHNGLAARDLDAEIDDAIAYVRNHPQHYGHERRQYETALGLLGSDGFSLTQTRHIAYELTRIMAGR